MADAIEVQTVTLQTRGGPMQAKLAVPAGEGKRGAVIVVPEAFGVTPGIADECRQLAAAGYLAIGIEIFHRTAAPGWASTTFEFSEAIPHFKALTNAGLAEDLASARDFLKLHPRASGKVAIVGYCVGGFAAYLGACESGVQASVVYYGGGIVHERPQLAALKPVIAENVKCPVLGLFGKEDHSIPESDRTAIEQALARAGVDHEVLAYEGAGHAFRNNERPGYAPAAAAESWSKALAFLGKYLS